MQANGVLRIRHDEDLHEGLTTVLVSISATAKRLGIDRQDLEELVMLKLLASHAAIPFELREPETERAPT